MVVSIVMVGTCQLWVPRWCTAKCIYAACVCARSPALPDAQLIARVHTAHRRWLFEKDSRDTRVSVYICHVCIARVQASRRCLSSLLTTQQERSAGRHLRNTCQGVLKPGSRNVAEEEERS